MPLEGPINIPPDAALLRLAVIINGRLADVGASVNFFRIMPEEGPLKTGIVFQCGERRAIATMPGSLDEKDADEVVQSVNEWLSRIRPESKWTTDPREAS